MFLDLRQDRYVSVPRTLMDTLAPQIVGWEMPPSTHDDSRSWGADADGLAQELLAAGILSRFQEWAPIAPGLPPPADSDFNSLVDIEAAETTPKPWTAAFAALITADYALRHTPLWRIVRRISLRAPIEDGYSHAETKGIAGTLSSGFRTIRPWYPRDYLCLFDSLALTLFLLRRGIRARWIFGVREDPFAAHCWVQYENVVLNEYLDRTRLYTPIMAV